MFGKLFNRFKAKPAPAPVPAKSGSATKETVKRAELPLPQTPPPSTPASPAKGPSKPEVKKPAAIPPVKTLTPEEVCGITPDMTPSQIKERLANLYRRHNRAAASLNNELREEAEHMLDAIVEVRHKYFGDDLA